MGEIYKVLYFGHKEVGDIYPFMGEDTKNKQEYYGWFNFLINISEL